jgi:hypothetical protein
VELLKNAKLIWASVVHAYNPGYLGAKIRRITVQDQPRQIVYDTSSLK